MAAVKGRASYKKKDGIVAVSDDRTVVSWTPTVTGTPALSIPIDTITNLQQTPDSAAKVALKIIVKATTEGGDPIAYLFTFTAPDEARAEANAIKDVLSNILATRSSDTGVVVKSSTPQPATNGNAANGSAAVSFASTASNNASKGPPRWFDDNQLRLDIALQQSLMKKDRTLHQTYMEARATKPESISDAAFNSQFWSTRTSLLRAHAIESSQKRATYNVLPTVKPYTDYEGKLKLNVTPQDIQMIFKQYPLVHRIHKEKVPKDMDEGAFWKGFFESNLARWLKGEDINPAQRNPVFDSHIRGDKQDALYFEKRMVDPHLPRIIDVQGNDENQGGAKGGNMPDALMRPNAERGAGARWLNAMSESLMSHTNPVDVGGTAAADGNENTYRELTLRDLNDDAPPDRIVLNVREQARFFDQEAGLLDDARAYEKQAPQVVLADYAKDLTSLGDAKAGGGIDLRKAIGVYDESGSDDDEEDSRKRPAHVGSRAARGTAQAHIWDGLGKRLAETQAQSEDEAAPLGLSMDLAQKAFITNATTTEFLQQFWNAFLSGDPDRAQELAHHVEALRRSVERIEAVAAEAEKAREQLNAQRRKQIVDEYNRTGRKLKFDPNSTKGGKKAVMALLGPTLSALSAAQGRYEEALVAEGIKPSTEE
ncbi:hypothetical protein MCOR27_008841 [Pyricularia oryzae]|uniref:BSD domain-containing protein n=3 Tax=Pyricularia TaxID=48558 RepID=A0ABQ8NN53_PYRGI|nr:hypothetical protein MCOR01_004569 [Pyricularia oryzae]KAI6299143.1 hypothetical protein MCOR33_004908 [Pyricularia grisea]KAH9431257.1 hypothetical protein MCOR02_008559 [Pyricularia oryzae]KAI6256286.1 hypothetical protein MCOR19_007230 [Pyricularia oryzae]KAI6271386.1 hypothetical protein MCOR27_008841 [Pyricularia oryzae]